MDCVTSNYIMNDDGVSLTIENEGIAANKSFLTSYGLGVISHSDKLPLEGKLNVSFYGRNERKMPIKVEFDLISSLFINADEYSNR